MFYIRIKKLKIKTSIGEILVLIIVILDRETTKNVSSKYEDIRITRY